MNADDSTQADTRLCLGGAPASALPQGPEEHLGTAPLHPSDSPTAHTPLVDPSAADPAELDGPDRKRRPLPLALLVQARPKQWAKNVLVFAAPGAAGVLFEGRHVLEALVAFVAFSLAASGTYYLNDAGDVEADRRHPTKRFRPIAAGEVPLTLARVLGPLLIVGGIAVSFAAKWELAVVVACYVTLTTAYTYWLKHLVLFDIVAVAAGFVLRAIGGAAATHVEVSNWFFIVATFGSLFMVAGKRHAEVRTVGAGGSTRAILSDYSESYLEFIRSASTAVVLVSYCLWAFEKAAEETGTTIPFFQLSIVPFALAILRYALLVDRGEGGAPEDVVFGDRVLLGIGAVWALLFGLGLHLR